MKSLLRFPEANYSLKGTDYLLENVNKVIHFTSLRNLYSIINEGHLRLYNLHNSNDPKEYEYAATLFKNIYKLQGFSDEDYDFKLNRIKEYSFIFSCTGIDKLNNSKYWEKYGDKKKGVAIEFEILNKPENWREFYFANVKYYKINDFIPLVDRWTHIQNKNKSNRYDISLDQLLSFHKSKKK